MKPSLSKILADARQQLTQVMSPASKTAFVPAAPAGGPPATPPPPAPPGPAAPPPGAPPAPAGSPPQGGGDPLQQIVQTIIGDPQILQMFMNDPNQFMQATGVTAEQLPVIQQAVQQAMQQTGGAAPAPQAAPPPPPAGAPAPQAAPPISAPPAAPGGMDPAVLQGIQTTFNEMGGRIQSLEIALKNSETQNEELRRMVMENNAIIQKVNAEHTMLMQQFAVIQQELANPNPGAIATTPGGM